MLSMVNFIHGQELLHIDSTSGGLFNLTFVNMSVYPLSLPG